MVSASSVPWRPKRIAEIQDDDPLSAREVHPTYFSRRQLFGRQRGTCCRCTVKRKDRTNYLVSSFLLHPEGMDTIDRGYDPDTSENLCCSIAGAFRFTRTGDWREEIPEHWLN